MQGSTVKERLLEKGVDGTYVTEDGQVVEYAAFYPTQIKSATDNTGEFNPDNNDIRYRKLDQAGFYSTVADALERLPQEKGTPDQMKAMLLIHFVTQNSIQLIIVFSQHLFLNTIAHKV